MVESTVTVDLNGDGDTADDLSNDTDQRGVGYDRHVFSEVDVGAFEYQPCEDISGFPYTASTPTELKLAIHCANTDAITDTIEISGTITLTEIDNVTDGNNGLPSITTPITIEGAGNIIERSSAITETFRLFHVASSGNLTLNDVRLQNGSAQNTDGSDADDEGAAIYSANGTLTVNNSILQNNTASNLGGAINADNGTTVITNTWIRGKYRETLPVAEFVKVMGRF